MNITGEQIFTELDTDIVYSLHVCPMWNSHLQLRQTFLNKGDNLEIFGSLQERRHIYIQLTDTKTSYRKKHDKRKILTKEMYVFVSINKLDQRKFIIFFYVFWITYFFEVRVLNILLTL